MKHFVGTWAHDFPDDPNWMAYEVTEDGRVVRQIEVFPGGRIEHRSAAAEGVVSLHDIAFDPRAFNFDDPAMTLVEVTQDEFNRFWADGPAR